jgi:hypothetical protein
MTTVNQHTIADMMGGNVSPSPASIAVPLSDDSQDAPGCNAAGHFELTATAKTTPDKDISTVTPTPQGLAADDADAKATDVLQEVADCNSLPFDWNSLAVDAAAELKRTTRRVLDLLEATAALDLQCQTTKIQIGDLLRSIKRQLRGKFTDSIKRELHISVKTSQRCMQISKFAEDKRDIVSFLSPSTTLLLAKKTTPPDIVDQVIARARSGDTVGEAVVKRMIEDEREKLRLAQRKTEEAAQSAARKSEKEKAAAERAVQRAERERKRQNAQAKAKSIVAHLLPTDLIFIAGVVDDRGVLDELFKILQRVRAGGAA